MIAVCNHTPDPEECILSKMYSCRDKLNCELYCDCDGEIYCGEVNKKFLQCYICLRYFAEIYCEIYCELYREIYCDCVIYCGEVNKKFLQCYICLRYWKCSTIFLWNVFRKWGEHFLFFDPNIRKEQIHSFFKLFCIPGKLQLFMLHSRCPHANLFGFHSFHSFNFVLLQSFDFLAT